MADEPIHYLRSFAFVDPLYPGTTPPSWAYANMPTYGNGYCVGFVISFSLSGGRYRKLDAFALLEEKIKKYGLDWIRKRGNVWSISFRRFREYLKTADKYSALGPVFDPFVGLHWVIDDPLTIEPDVEYVWRSRNREPRSEDDFNTHITFLYRIAELIRNRPMRIFLSHKGADKALVRNFSRTLKTLGFHPWLDEDDMPSGISLERGLLQGFKDSCAAVFFITQNFRDENYLATEVEYAIQQERAKGDKFKIILIVFKGKGGAQGAVPELLKTKVWKTPKTQLEALREIIKALPIELGPPVWK